MRPTTLLHPLCLLALILLAWNDLYAKQAFPGWWTGKLSDFSGLFLFAIVLISLFPRKKILLLSLTGLAWLWWKSPFSEVFLDWWSSNVFPIQRVIDYSDWLALIVLPLIYYWLRDRSIVPPKHWRFPEMAITVVVILAFSNTSRQPHFHFDRGNLRLSETYTFKMSETELFHAIDTLGINYTIDSVGYASYNSVDTFYSVFYRLKDIVFETGDTIKEVNFKLYKLDQKRINLSLLGATIPRNASLFQYFPKIRKLRRKFKKRFKKDIIKDIKRQK